MMSNVKDQTLISTQSTLETLLLSHAAATESSTDGNEN